MSRASNSHIVRAGAWWLWVSYPLVPQHDIVFVVFSLLNLCSIRTHSPAVLHLLFRGIRECRYKDQREVDKNKSKVKILPSSGFQPSVVAGKPALELAYFSCREAPDSQFPTPEQSSTAQHLLPSSSLDLAVAIKESSTPLPRHHLQESAARQRPIAP
jgi:hypothetical protein